MRFPVPSEYFGMVDAMRGCWSNILNAARPQLMDGQNTSTLCNGLGRWDKIVKESKTIAENEVVPVVGLEQIEPVFIALRLLPHYQKRTAS